MSQSPSSNNLIADGSDDNVGVGLCNEKLPEVMATIEENEKQNDAYVSFQLTTTSSQLQINQLATTSIPIQNIKTELRLDDNDESYTELEVIFEDLKSDLPTHKKHTEPLKPVETSEEVLALTTLGPSSEQLPSSNTTAIELLADHCSPVSMALGKSHSLIVATRDSSINGEDQDVLKLEPNFGETVSEFPVNNSSGKNNINSFSEPLLRSPSGSTTTDKGDHNLNSEEEDELETVSNTEACLSDQRQVINLADVPCYARLLMAANGKKTINNEDQLVNDLQIDMGSIEPSTSKLKVSNSYQHQQKNPTTSKILPTKSLSSRTEIKREEEEISDKTKTINKVPALDEAEAVTIVSDLDSRTEIERGEEISDKTKTINKVPALDEAEAVTIVSDSDTSSDEDVSGFRKMLPHQTARANILKPRKLLEASQSRRGTLYTDDEEKKIVKYINEHNAYKLIKGKSMWQDMEIAAVCPGRTWQSLKERFMKYTIKRIRKFATPVQVEKFRKGICRDKSETRSANVAKVYSQEENKAIVEYVLKNSRYKSVGGNNMWKKLEENGLIKGRTWQSMREHYRKVLVHNLGGLGVTQTEAAALRTYCPGPNNT